MLYSWEGGAKISLKSHFLTTSNGRGSLSRSLFSSPRHHPICPVQSAGWTSSVGASGEEVGGVSDDCLISLREAGENFAMCLDKDCIACPVSIGQETLRDWDLTEVLARL